MDNENLIDSMKKICGELGPTLFDDLLNGHIKNEDKYKKLIKESDGDLYKPYLFAKENMKHFKVVLLLSKQSQNESLLKLAAPYRVV